MDIEPGARGVVIGDRYRVAGALRRTGLIDAVDLEADRGAAACRIVAVPGDAERVDQWEDAWRAAQAAARLPRLRELVDDGEGGHWAVLDGSPAAGAPLPPDARRQAALIGEALADAGLDARDVRAGMLVGRPDGVLALDGVVWLGGDLAPRAAGIRVADLLPLLEPLPDPAPSDAGAPRPAARRAGTGRRRHRRLLIPLAAVALVAAAALVLGLPAGSSGTAVIAPAGPVEGGALLAAGSYPAVAPTAPATVAALEEPAVVTVTTERTVTMVVTDVVVADAPAPVVEGAPIPAVPLAAAPTAPDLPLAAPALPVAGG